MPSALDLDVAGALEGDVERAAGLLQGALAVVAADHGRRGAGAEAQRGRRARRSPRRVGEVAEGHADAACSPSCSRSRDRWRRRRACSAARPYRRLRCTCLPASGNGTSIRRGLRSRRSSQRTLLSSEVVGRSRRGFSPGVRPAQPGRFPTCEAVCCSVASIVVIARCVASMARMEAMRSTIARAGSTPEPSSEPALDLARGLAAGLAGEVRVALLDRVAQVEERDLGRVDGAVGDRDGLAAHAEDLVAELVDEVALGVGREGAVARVAHALVGLHAEVAVARDREVERLAGLAQRLRAKVGHLLVDGGALAERPDGRAVGAVAQHQVAEASAARRGRPCSPGWRRWRGRWRADPGEPSRRACRRLRCRGHVPCKCGRRRPMKELECRSRLSSSCCAPRWPRPRCVPAPSSPRACSTTACCRSLGARVPATLPEDVRPGDVLRLPVKEAGPERILLQVVQQPPPVATRRRSCSPAAPPRA